MQKIVFEGPCCAGKSLCIKNLMLNDENLHVMEYNDFEHKDIIFPPLSREMIMEAMTVFLEVERMRYRQIRKAATSNLYKNALIDRSFITLLAFQYAISHIIGLEMIRELELFWESKKEVIRPTKVVILNVSHEVQIKRAGEARDKYLSVLLEEDFNQKFVNYIKLYCKTKGYNFLYVNTDLLCPAKVVKIVRRFL